MSKAPITLTPEQASHLRDILLVVGVSDDVTNSVAALNGEFVNRCPLGPHNQEGVSNWINNITSEARKVLVPLVWKPED